ncbi:MAG: hypothetical protein HOE53_04225 [Candidatus Magasanikbacteria bacterium]|jgi:hypothetical protein|nr:hypothetical protein [Candidatus Magasanikbacteria bacterium]
MTRKNKGILFTILGPTLFILALPLWAIARFVINAGAIQSVTAVQLINILISLSAIGGVLVLFPLGIYFIATANKQ